MAVMDNRKPRRSEPPSRKSGKPLSPEAIVQARRAAIPADVFDVFNELIAKNMSGGQAIVKQDEVVAILVERMGVPRQSIFDKHWLDVEAAFRKEGWVVEYDKPGFNETYDAYFRFIRRRPSGPRNRR